MSNNPVEEIEILTNRAVNDYKCFDGTYYTEKIYSAKSKNEKFYWIKISRYQERIKKLYRKLYQLNLNRVKLGDKSEIDFSEFNEDLNKIQESRIEFVSVFDGPRGNHMETQTRNSKLLSELVKCDGLTQVLYYNLYHIRKGNDYLSNSKNFKQTLLNNKNPNEMETLEAYDRFGGFFDFVEYNFDTFLQKHNFTFKHLWSALDLVGEVSTRFGGVNFDLDFRKIIEETRNVKDQQSIKVLKFLKIKPILTIALSSLKNYVQLEDSKRRSLIISPNPFDSLSKDGTIYFDMLGQTVLQKRIALTGIEKKEFKNTNMMSVVKSFFNQYKDFHCGHEYFDEMIAKYVKNASIILDVLIKDEPYERENMKNTLKKLGLVPPELDYTDKTDYNEV